jgi:hypothetical protein
LELIDQRAGLFEVPPNGIRSLQRGELDKRELRGVSFDEIVAKIRQSARLNHR